MRKLSLLLAALVMTAGLSVQAGAATLTLTGNTLSLGVGTLPAITVPGNGASIVVTTGKAFTEPAGVFGPSTAVLAVSLFTGVPSISGLSVVGMANPPSMAVSAGGAAVGGLAGTANVNVLQFAALPIPLTVVGNPGATAMASLGAIKVTVYGQGWTTGTAKVTGVTSTLPGTTVVNTVTLSGTDSRTVNGVGQVTLISAFRAFTSVGFILPSLASQVLTFTPEPGTLMLLGSGVLGLAVLGRRRMRK